MLLLLGWPIAGSAEVVLHSGLERPDIRLAEGVVPGESRQWTATDLYENDWLSEGVLLRDSHGRGGGRGLHFDGAGQALTVTLSGGMGIGDVSFWYHPLSAAPSEYTLQLHVKEGDEWTPLWSITHEDTRLEWINAVVEVQSDDANELRWVMTAHESRGIMVDDLLVSAHGTSAADARAAVRVPSLRRPAPEYTTQSSRPEEGWGLTFNSDGDLTATDPDPEVSTENLRELLGRLAESPVKTVMYSIGAGSDILYFPSEYGSHWGWRVLPEYEDHPRWSTRIKAGRAHAEAGVDMFQVVADIVDDLGLTFIPSVRMNDAHYVFSPRNYPLTGEFWMNNQDKTIGESPIAGADYSATLNFLHEEVRNYRLGIIGEVIERYGGQMEGIELDFNRFQVFFPPGRAEEGMPLMTGLVREVRKMLDERSKETGRTYSIFARVPPAIRNCHWSGLDIGTWAQEGLVDVIIPAQLMTIAHDLPVREFVDLLDPHGVKVMPAIYGRTQWNAPMTIEIPSAIPGEDIGRGTTPAQAAGVVLNGLYQGAHGFQGYNMGFPSRPDQFRTLDYMNDATLIGERAYMVTKGYFLDHEDNYQYRKQIPLELEAGGTHRVTMLIGEDLSRGEVLASTARTLRLGFRDALDRGTTLSLSVNGRTIHDGALEEALVPVVGPSRGAGAYVYFPLDGRDVFQEGDNEFMITLTPGEGTLLEATELVEVQLLVAPLESATVSTERGGR